MKIVVISLQQSLERRESIRLQFDAAGVPFEFFDAIDGAGVHAHLHHFDGTEFFRNTGRAATANEIACYASHVAAWHQCADDKEPFVILEDDARIGLSFAEAIRELEKSINRRGFIRLSMPAARSSMRLESLGSFELRYCRKVPLMMLGYAVSPAAAKRLADAAVIVEEPIDKFLQRFWRHGQPVFALRPSVVFQHPIGATSDVGSRMKPPYTVATWTMRVRRKLRNSLLRSCFNLSFYAARAFPWLRTRFEFLQLASRRTG